MTYQPKSSVSVLKDAFVGAASYAAAFVAGFVSGEAPSKGFTAGQALAKKILSPRSPKKFS
jgi:hypothetical protein